MSWLPPTHPDSQASKSAAAIRKEMEEEPSPNDAEDDEEAAELSLPNVALPPPLLNVAAPSSPPLPPPPMPQPPPKRPKYRDLEKAIRSKHERRSRGGYKPPKNLDVLDPMDPAAYSDIPRGTWASGLEQEDKKVAGVDSTVSGTAFQQRPYPSPGAVLAANAAATKKRRNSDDDDEDVDNDGNYGGEGSDSGEK